MAGRSVGPCSVVGGSMEDRLVGRWSVVGGSVEGLSVGPWSVAGGRWPVDGRWFYNTLVLRALKGIITTI